jgi:hypothetical protein
MPQWSPQNRPTVVRAKPANGKRPGTQLFYPATSCAGNQGNHLLFFRFVQDVAHIDEGYRALRRIQRPRASFSLAGFQVTFIGRFWVTAEGMTFSLSDSPVVIELVSPVRTLWYVAVLHSSLSLLNCATRIGFSASSSSRRSPSRMTGARTKS